MVSPRADRGVHWFVAEVTPQELGTGGHVNSGWDFHDGGKKVFFVGSGWKSGKGDFRYTWGLWDARGNRFAFSAPVAQGKRVTLRCKIDFEQDTVALYLEGDQPVAVFDDLDLAGVDRVTPFTGKGAKYTWGKPAWRSDEPRIDGEALFVSTIRPLFKAKCLACHGDDEKKIKGDLDMRTRAGLLQGGESEVTALVPGDPEKSLLYVALTWEDEDLEMPPKENDRLTAAQKSEKLQENS